MTNKVALRTVEEFMSDYKPTYQPIYPLFMSKSQSYPAEVGSMNFKRLEAIGDIRAKHVTPKDTELKQLAAKVGSKTFKRYFLANQFTVSALQSREGVESVAAQVLDEHQKQFDELFLLGEGTSASTMINNGLFWSDDANYLLESSAEVDKGAAEDHLKDMHTKIMITAAKANEIDGQKVVIVYGTTACAKFDSLYANTDAPFKKVLAEVLGAGYTLAKLPNAITPSGANGWIIANIDQVKLHYTELPSLKSQGVNDEKMYAWMNFLMGSSMLEVLVQNAIIRQPVTFEA